MSQSAETQPTFIVKRDGRLQKFDTRKATAYLQSLSWGLDMSCVSLPNVIRALVERMPVDAMGAEPFLIFLAEVVASFSSHHPDYSILAGRVFACHHHRRIPKVFSAWVLSYEQASPPLFTDRVFAAVRSHADAIDAAIVHQRDFSFTYRSLQMFEESYLIKEGCELRERLQFLFMRVSIGIHGDSLADVLESYELLSTRKLSFASPALWNGGLANRHIASCFIFEPFAVKPSDAISNFSALSTLWSTEGEVGISAGDVPATREEGGAHPGLLPLLRVYDALGAYWSRSSRHRTSSAAVYVPIWHADVRKFVLSRTNRAPSHYRFRHLFPALWVPNLLYVSHPLSVFLTPHIGLPNPFLLLTSMRRLESNDTWSLFDPDHVRGLSDLYSNAFEAAYIDYERQGLATACIRARALWDIISEATRESGTPFIMYADNVNARNNHMHLGIIKSSNLSTEVIQYSSPIETSVCTLASLCLPQYLRGDGTFNYPELLRVSKFAVLSLDRMLELGNYPTTDAAVSVFRTRSIAIGVQGLADVFATLEKPFTSPVARTISRHVAETVYFGALEASCELAEALGPHDSWPESPAQQGVLQLDMWDGNVTGEYDFDGLRDRIRLHGLRNSMLTAQMPTASTAKLFGHSEGVDPHVSNVTHFHVLGGNYTEISRPLIKSLQRRGIWSERMRADILASRGSVQKIQSIPDELKIVFRTAFELDPHDLVAMAADRGPFIDQSQSFNLFVAEPTSAILMDLQLHAWRSGLKTGAYHVLTKPPTDPKIFGVARHSWTPSPTVSSSSAMFVDALPYPLDA